MVEIPKDIRSEFKGYDFIVSWIYRHRDLADQIIIFDFVNVTFMEANLCALMGALFEMLEEKNNKIHIININRHVETILRKNEFLLSFGYDKLEDNYDTSLTYRKFTPIDDIGFNNYIQKELLTKSGFPSHSYLLGKEIVRNIFEIYENARTHGECEFIHTCGQFFPKHPDKPLHFTIVDKGINIKQNVSNFHNEDLDAGDAIKWAMIKGNTTKTGNTSGGLGLSVIFEFIKLNKGKIQVISSDGFYEFKNGVVETHKLGGVFDGTIVNFNFNLNDSNHYLLSSEADEDDIIF